MSRTSSHSSTRLAGAAVFALSGVVASGAHAQVPRDPAFDRMPARPPYLAPMRDDTGHPMVKAVAAGLRKQLGRPRADSAENRALAGLPPPARLVNEDRGHIAIIRGDQGELDVNWNDQNQLQNALLTVIQAYYDTHPGRNPHFITVLTTFTVDSVAAFYLPLANDVRGIGYQRSTGDEIFRSVPGLALDGVIFLNSFRNYAGQNAPLGRLTFNQELGHRWGSFVYFQDRDGPSAEMLGRDCAHWSFLMDSENSAMEGNVWRDNGNRTFTTETSFYNFGFNPLDRYLMGFAPAESVPDWFLVTDVGAWDCSQPYRGQELNPSYYPPIFGGVQDQVTVRGTRVNISIDDVIAAEGERRPGYAQSPKEFSMAFVVAAKRNDAISDRNIEVVDELRREWEAQWEQDATQPGYPSPNLVTTADGSGDPGPGPGPGPDPGPSPGGIGARCSSFADCDPSVAERCVGLEAGVSICTKLCDVDRDCPSDFCCVPSMPGDQQDRFNWYCVAQQGAACQDFSQPDPTPSPGGSVDPAGSTGGTEPPPGGGSMFPPTAPAAPDGGPSPPTDPTDPTGAERVQVSGESKSVTGCSARPAQGGAAWLLAPVTLALVARRRRR